MDDEQRREQRRTARRLADYFSHNLMHDALAALDHIVPLDTMDVSTIRLYIAQTHKILHEEEWSSYLLVFDCLVEIQKCLHIDDSDKFTEILSRVKAEAVIHAIIDASVCDVVRIVALINETFPERAVTELERLYRTRLMKMIGNPDYLLRYKIGHKHECHELHKSIMDFLSRALLCVGPCHLQQAVEQLRNVIVTFEGEEQEPAVTRDTDRDTNRETPSSEEKTSEARTQTILTKISTHRYEENGANTLTVQNCFVQGEKLIMFSSQSCCV